MLTTQDLRRVLGHLDESKSIRILALSPDMADLEAAAICLAGDEDVIAKSAHHVSGMSEAIVEIICEGKAAGEK